MRMKKWRKASWGVISVALTMAMAVGIFAGTGMEVRAASTIEETLNLCTRNDCNWTPLGIGVETGTTCKLEGNNGEYFKLVVCYFKEDVDTKNLKTHTAIEQYVDNSNTNLHTDTYSTEETSHSFSVETYGGISKWDIEGVLFSGEGENKEMIIFLTLAKNSTSESPSSSTGQSDVSTPAPHTHSYLWETVQEATVGQDGLEEYRCSCGDVQGRSVIPASVAAVSGLYDAIHTALQNGTASFDSGRLYTLSDYMVKKLAERTDITTVITFEYQNQAYKMTIPAGADYTKLLADSDYFYGYFYFANVIGATIETL